MKKLIELHKKLEPSPTNWQRNAGISNKIADLTMELYIGDPSEKISALDGLARYAHLARDKNLVNKAMDTLRGLADEIKLEYMRRCYEILKTNFSHWSTEFNSGIPPEKSEMDFIKSKVFDV